MLYVGYPKPKSCGASELNRLHILSLLILFESGLPIGIVWEITGFESDDNAYVSFNGFVPSDCWTLNKNEFTLNDDTPAP